MKDDLVRAQLDEAGKLTKTAISVARLSKLTFLFIRFNLVTIFVGMNVKQFRNNNVDLWVIFLSALGLLGMTLVPFMIPVPITLCVLKLFLRPPFAGVWLLLFWCFHSRATTLKICCTHLLYFASHGRTLNPGNFTIQK